MWIKNPETLLFIDKLNAPPIWCQNPVPEWVVDRIVHVMECARPAPTLPERETECWDFKKRVLTQHEDFLKAKSELKVSDEESISFCLGWEAAFKRFGPNNAGKSAGVMQS